jgi:hypothetical protein
LLGLTSELQRLTGQSASGITEAAVANFSTVFDKHDVWNTFRINPVQLVKKNAMEQSETIGLFIYGTKAGIFSFEWGLRCGR